MSKILEGFMNINKRPYPNELESKLISDFTLIITAINSKAKPSINSISKKCQVLTPDKLKEIFQQLNMINVRNKRFNLTQELLPRRTKKEIRELIVNELKKAPSLSLYELKSSTNLAYATLHRFIEQDSKQSNSLLKVARSGRATYVALNEEYRN